MKQKKCNACCVFFMLVLSLFIFASCNEIICHDCITGVAMDDAPLKGTVFICDSMGQTISTSTKRNGSFRADVAEMIPPFVVRAEGTVKDKPVIYYSFSTNNDHVNITPLTHLAMALALKQAPVDYYADSNAGPPESVLVDEAVLTLTHLFSGVYEDLGVVEDFNLMEDEFNAHSKGFSHLLELVDVMVDQSACDMRTKDGNVLFSDHDLADDTAPMAVPPEHAQAMLTGLEMAKAFLALSEKNNADGVLTQEESEAFIDFYSPGAFHRGSNFEELKEILFSEASTLKGITFDQIEFYRMMYTPKDHPLGGAGISEVSDDTVAFWCSVRSDIRGRMGKGLTGFIRQNGQWKYYGNRNPFTDNIVLPLAAKILSENGLNMYSGLSLSIRDQALFGQKNNVKKILIVNESLPEIVIGEDLTMHGVVLMPGNTPETEALYTIALPERLAGQGSYLTALGLNLDVLANNQEFNCVALDENNLPIYVWTTRIWENPLPVPQLFKLAETVFSKLALDNREILPVVSLSRLQSGPDLSWTMADQLNLVPVSATMTWYQNGQVKIGEEVINNPGYLDSTLNYNDWSEQAFNAPPSDWLQQSGQIAVASLTPLGSVFSSAVRFRVGEPQPVTFKKGYPYISCQTNSDGSIRHVAHMAFINNGQPAAPSDISHMELTSDNGYQFNLESPQLDIQRYYFIEVNGATMDDVVWPPFTLEVNGANSEYQILLPEDSDLPVSNDYACSATINGLYDDYTIEKDFPAPMLTEMPVINDGQSLWSENGALTFIWTPPDSEHVTQLSLQIYTLTETQERRHVLNITFTGEGLLRSQFTIPPFFTHAMTLYKQPGPLFWSIETRRFTTLPSDDTEMFELARGVSEDMQIPGF